MRAIRASKASTTNADSDMLVDTKNMHCTYQLSSLEKWTLAFQKCLTVFSHHQSAIFSIRQRHTFYF